MKSNIHLAKKHFLDLGVDYPDERFNAEEEALEELLERDEFHKEDKLNIHIDVHSYADLGLVAQHLYKKRIM